MAGLLGMGGLGGLNNSAATGLLKGNLAALFNPTSMRNQQIKQGLLNAGLAMMNPDPHAPPAGFGGMLGRAAAGGMQGAYQAKNDFYNDGMMNMQLMQLQQEQNQQAQQSAAMESLIPTLPPDIQAFARAYPQQFGEAYLKAKMPGQDSWQEVTLEDGVYAVNKNNPTQKMKIGERANRNEGEGREFTQTTKLRGDYTKAAKPFEDLRVQYQRMIASYEGAQADDTGASDIAMVYSYMKMLDPTSVVRESEFATAQNAAGVPEQIRTMWNRLKSGDRLDPSVRDAFLDQATRQYQEQLNSYGQTRSMYQGFAGSNQLDPDQVAPDLTYGVVPYQRKSNLNPDTLRQKYNLKRSR